MASGEEGKSLFGDVQGGQAARVTRTGIALVHEGELVLPAAGSEAAAEIIAHEDRITVNYYFPVEIEVRGGAEVEDPRQLIQQALRNFVNGIENIA